MNRTVVVVVTRTDNGFEIHDANGKKYTATSSVELGIACQKVLNDLSLPELETQTVRAAEAQTFAVKLAEAVLPPKYAFAAPEVVAAAKAVAKGVGSALPERVSAPSSNWQESLGKQEKVNKYSCLRLGKA